MSPSPSLSLGPSRPMQPGQEPLDLTPQNHDGEETWISLRPVPRPRVSVPAPPPTLWSIWVPRQGSRPLLPTLHPPHRSQWLPRPPPGGSAETWHDPHPVLSVTANSSCWSPPQLLTPPWPRWPSCALKPHPKGLLPSPGPGDSGDTLSPPREGSGAWAGGEGRGGVVDQRVTGRAVSVQSQKGRCGRSVPQGPPGQWGGRAGGLKEAICAEAG